MSKDIKKKRNNTAIKDEAVKALNKRKTTNSTVKKSTSGVTDKTKPLMRADTSKQRTAFKKAATGGTKKSALTKSSVSALADKASRSLSKSNTKRGITSNNGLTTSAARAEKMSTKRTGTTKANTVSELANSINSTRLDKKKKKYF